MGDGSPDRADALVGGLTELMPRVVSSVERSWKYPSALGEGSALRLPTQSVNPNRSRYSRCARGDRAPYSPALWRPEFPERGRWRAGLARYPARRAIVLWWTPNVLATSRQLSPLARYGSGLGLLVFIQFRLAPKLSSPLLRGGPAFIGAPQDTRALFLRPAQTAMPGYPDPSGL